MQRPDARPVATRPAYSTEYLDRLCLERTKSLNPYVQRNLEHFRVTFDAGASAMFAQLSRHGREQGGVILYYPKENRFSFQIVQNEAAEALLDSIAKAKRGDFSKLRMLQDAVRATQFVDKAEMPGGQVVTITADHLLERFRFAQALWAAKSEAIREHDTKRLFEIEHRISDVNEIFNFLDARLVQPNYIGTGVIENFFTDKTLFEESSDKRLFAHFHTHPIQVVENQSIYGGPISENDLRNTKQVGPAVVLEYGSDYNAVWIGIDGKIAFTKKYPLTSQQPASAPR
ncbi:MAG: hypothetical protein Q7R47_04655 [Candidatus Diapherotrites archaeon]|nr:hypothetical protein [Candidatus Diapherotrites archaeon]